MYIVYEPLWYRCSGFLAREIDTFIPGFNFRELVKKYIQVIGVSYHEFLIVLQFDHDFAIIGVQLSEDMYIGIKFVGFSNKAQFCKNISPEICETFISEQVRF